MKPLILSLTDRSQRGAGDSAVYSRPLKLLRRICGLKDSLADTRGDPRPSILERLDDFLQWRPKEAPDCEEISSGNHTGIDQVLHSAPAETKEVSDKVSDAETSDSVNLASKEEGVTQLPAAQQETDRNLGDPADDYQKRLADLFVLFEEQAQHDLRRFREKEAKELESFIKTTTEQARNQFRQMLNESLAKGLGELEIGSRQIAKEKRQRHSDTVSSKATEKSISRYLGESSPTAKRRARSLWTGLIVGIGLVAVALILGRLYASAPPLMRLRAEPPAGFIDDRPDWSAKRRTREEQLARTYWERAVQDVQARYKFGENLPDEPPAEFTAEEKNLPGSSPKIDPVARARYWGKVRHFWTMPEAWDKSSRLDTEWIRSVLQQAYLRVKELVTG